MNEVKLRQEGLKILTEVLSPMGFKLVQQEYYFSLVQEKTSGRIDYVFENQIKDTKNIIFADFRRTGRLQNINRFVEYFCRLELFTSNHYDKDSTTITFLLVVPSMSEQSKEICKAANLNYITLDGYVYITIKPYIFIDRLIKGRDNYFVDEYDTIYANLYPKLISALLSEPERNWKVTELSNNINVNKGTISKILTVLIREGYLNKLEPNKEYPRGFFKVLNIEGLKNKYLK